jgi:prepilin-type N-terminal cleavage/methylation domain-containing protein
MTRARGEAGFSAVELLTVMAVMAVAASMAVPLVGNMMASFRIAGDLRGLSQSTAVAKMRAAATFSNARVFVDLGAETYRVETWQKPAAGNPGQWNIEVGTTQPLSTGVNFGFGGIAAAPPNTQTTIGQAPQCRDNANQPIANTACIVYNSRGLPFNPATNVQDNSGAFYLSDPTVVYAVTVSATGMQRTWRRPLTGTSSVWSLQ